MSTDTQGKGRRRSLWKGPAAVAAVFFSILLVASRLIDDWRWPPGAFVVVGFLFFSVGFAYQVVTRSRDAIPYRLAVGIAFVAGFLLMWSNFVQMADVTPFSVIYFAVPVVGLIGAAVARLRPRGMTRALFVTAMAQASAVVVVVMLVMRRHPEVAGWSEPELRGVFGNTVLAVMFGTSALLFRRAGREESP